MFSTQEVIDRLNRIYQSKDFNNYKPKAMGYYYGYKYALGLSLSGHLPTDDELKNIHPLLEQDIKEHIKVWEQCLEKLQGKENRERIEGYLQALKETIGE